MAKTDPWMVATIALATFMFWVPAMFWVAIRQARLTWNIEQTARDVAQARQTMEADQAELRRELTNG